MTLETVKEKINGIHKGAFTRISYRTNPKTLAKATKDNVTITKETQAVVRLGITYANMKANENKVTGEMNGVQWLESEINYLVENTKGEVMLRVYSAPHKSKTTYYINETPTTKSELIANGYLSDKAGTKPLCYNIKIANIVSIG